MIEAAYSMVGHPGLMVPGSSFPGQSVGMPYSRAMLTAGLQNPTNLHILAQAGLTHPELIMGQKAYDLLYQQQPSPVVSQPTNNTVQSQQQDHPIGYGAFGVVW